MPQSTLLPAQAVEFRREGWYPKRGRGRLAGAALNTAQFTRVKPANLSVAYNEPAGFGNLGGDPILAVRNGRPCARSTTAAATFARGWSCGWWNPGWDAAAFNPGALLDPLSVVLALDFNVACSQAAFVAGTGDISGFWWIPSEQGAPNFFQATPGSGSGIQRGGWGLALNDDGAGNNQWEFVSFDGGPVNVVQRTPVPVADVTDFNRFRFQLISAASGRPATLTLLANGSAVAGLDGKEFDDVTLFRPATLTSVAIRWAWGVVLGDMGGAGFDYDIYWRTGRFTPDGQQVQAV